jgi:hypothetical protein
MSLKDFLNQNDPAKLTLAQVDAEITRLSQKADSLEYNFWNSSPHLDAAKMIRANVDALSVFKARLLADAPALPSFEIGDHYRKGSVVLEAGVVWQAAKDTWASPSTASADWTPIVGTPAPPTSQPLPVTAPAKPKRKKAAKSKEEQEDDAFEAEVQDLAESSMAHAGFTPEQLARPASMRLLFTEAASMTVTLRHVLRQRDDQIKELNDRLLAVESGGIRYCGVWQKAMGYPRGSVVTSDGSAWCALKDVPDGEKPGASECWQLMVKAGKDARP